MTEAQKDLYRPEFGKKKGPSFFGTVIISPPLRLTWIAIFVFSLSALLVAFVFFGQYTRRVTVTGQVSPIGGIIKVYPQQPGVVTNLYIEEGSSVSVGQKLFQITAEKSSIDGPLFRSTINRLNLQKKTLEYDLRQQEKINSQDSENLTSEIKSLRESQEILEQQISNQRKLIAIVDDAERRYEALYRKGFISMDQFQQRQAEKYAQLQQIDSLIKERVSLKQEISAKEGSLATLRSELEIRESSAKRQILSIENEIASNRASQDFWVVSPISGNASALFVHKGQSVDQSSPLVNILPINEKFQVELYVPSKAIGFIKTGEKVKLRFDAFPYQKFGQYDGQVSEISKSPIADMKSSKSSVNITANAADLVRYRIIVKLNNQSILAYGKHESIQPGMTVEADIMQETRKLYEWALEPILSIRKKI